MQATLPNEGDQPSNLMCLVDLRPLRKDSMVVYLRRSIIAPYIVYGTKLDSLGMATYQLVVVPILSSPRQQILQRGYCFYH